MKPNFKSLLILSFFALLFVSSCQNEFLEESSQNQEETLVPNSNLTLALRSTAANNGSMDDLLDESSCFSVNLPVTIIVNDITVTINTLEDLEIIEELYDEFDDDEDNLEFLFPITIILNDYEEIVIASQDDLEAFIEDCTQNSSNDEIIECVDFVYPITVSIYDANFQVIENVTFNSDDELYYFLDELEDDSDNQVIIASLNFPVTLIYADGSTLEVNSNPELQAAIDAAEEDCSDEDTCSNEDLAANLQECYWEIESYNGDDNYQEVDFIFMEDGTIKVLNSNGFFEYGTWNLSVSDNNFQEIVMDGFQEYQMFNGSWIVTECDDDELVIVKEVEGITTTIVLDQDCEDDLDCTAQEMIQELKECKWWMGTNLLSPNYSGPLFFEEDNVLLVGYPDNNQLEGTWEVALTDSGIYMFLTIGGDYEVIALDWKLFECDDDRFKFVSGDNYLVLEQECEPEYDCYAEDINSNLVECVWFGVTNLYDTLAPEIFTFNSNGTVSTQSSGGETIGTYTVVSAENNVNIVFDFNSEPYNLLSTEWLVIECEDNRVKAVNGENYVLFEQDCEWSPGPLGCLEASAIVKCDENNDGFEVFNLYEGLNEIENCEIYNAVSVSYHTSLVDAESDVNELTGVTSYTNVSNPQTIYVRVEVLNNPSQFEILEIELLLEDCSQGSCTEEVVDSYLMECHWVAVSYNGDDQLAGYDIYFNENMDLSIEGDGTTYQGVWSTSENSNNGVTLDISQLTGGTPEDLNNQWQVVECTEAQIILVGTNNVELVLERDCESTNNCTEQELDAILMECVWIPVNVNGSDDYIASAMVFGDGQAVTIEGFGETYTGNWQTSGNSENGVWVTITQLGGNFDPINGQWLVVECSAEMLHLQSGDNILILERECN